MPDVTSSRRVDVGERRDAELGRADQLRVDAARPEGDERAEDGILDKAGQQLDAAGDHRLDDDRTADALDRGTDLGLVAQVERDAAGLRLVRAGLGGLDDDREAQRGGRGRGLAGGLGERARGRAGSRSCRAARAPRPASASRRRRGRGRLLRQPSRARGRRGPGAGRCPAAAAAIRRAQAARPSARAADSGYGEGGDPARGQPRRGMPPSATTAASTGLSGCASRTTRGDRSRDLARRRPSPAGRRAR